MLEHGVRTRQFQLDDDQLVAFQTAPRIPLASILGEQDAFRDFIEEALRITPADRPTAEELLGHEWLTEEASPGSMKRGEADLGGDSFDFDTSFDSDSK
jgi:hypothetical protein